MNLTLASSIASDSLGAITNQIGTVSRNISGVNTPGYSAKIAQLATDDNGSAEVKGIIRATNTELLKNLLQSTSGQASSQAVSDGLAQIERLLNLTSGSAADLATSFSPAAKLSKLKTAMQQFGASPSNAAAADTAVAAAKDLAQSLNGATETTQQVRRLAEQGMQDAVTQINDILVEFHSVNKAIMTGAAKGDDITDKLDQRDDLLKRLTANIGISTFVRPNSDMVIYTDSGVTLFETSPRMVSFQANPSLSAATSGMSVMIDGVPVTLPQGVGLSARSGKLVGLAELRDVIAPKFQSQLDEIARGLAMAFAESHRTNPATAPQLGLFAVPGMSAVPQTHSPGLAGLIVVNANVDPDQGGDSMRLRDGGISHPNDPAYLYNSSGASGYSERILQLISNLSAPQSFDAQAGNGANASVSAYATSSIGWLAAQRQRVDKASTYQSAMLAQSTQALSNATGVNLDDQMSKMLALENSYQASAKLLATINSMYSTLFEALRI